MRAIQPVHLHDKGAKVSNLHKGLLFLLLHQSISDNDRETLQQRLAAELRGQTFGSVTEELVGMFQNQLKQRAARARSDVPDKLKEKLRNLPVSDRTGRGNGDVDELTAEGLNWLLTKLGALEPE